MHDKGGTSQMTDAQTVQLSLSTDDLQLVRTALRVLLSTLGREEADELRQVPAILERIDAALP
jgi:hypothetical protein